MPITFNGRILVEPRVAAMRGMVALGFHRLVVDLELQLYPGSDGETILSDLTADLSVAGEGLAVHAGWLHPVAPPVWTPLRADMGRRIESLELQLPRNGLELIEDLRMGGKLTFSLILRGRLSRQLVTQTFADQVSHEVNQGTWVEVLQQLGYSRTMLLEVPVPDERASPGLAGAVGYLRQAHRAMLNGSWRESVGSCRDVLEALSTALGDGDLQDAQLIALLDGSRNWSKDQRLRALRRVLKVMTHPARHADEVSARIEWDRTDAQVMVTMLSALLQRVVQ